MAFNTSDLYLILFQRINGIGIKKLQDIYKKFGDYQRAYNVSLSEYEGIIKEKRILSNISKFLENRDDVIKEVKKIDKELSDNNIKFLSYFDNKYPNTLRKIDNPPIILYFKGEFLFDKLEKSISIVGTRNPSSYGHSKARLIAKELAANGYIIVSGLARGIDLESHLGALEEGGRTIAILGSGVENIYPPEHKNLTHDIIENGGAIISEVYIGQKSYPHNLVNRNRIISGLSRASLIIEGDLNSGTRHEANFAKMQNKLIFVLRPLDPRRKVSQLPLNLIIEDAIEIQSSSEILHYLNSRTNQKNPRAKLIEKGITDFIK